MLWSCPSPSARLRSPAAPAPSLPPCNVPQGSLGGPRGVPPGPRPPREGGPGQPARAPGHGSVRSEGGYSGGHSCSSCGLRTVYHLHLLRLARKGWLIGAPPRREGWGDARPGPASGPRRSLRPPGAPHRYGRRASTAVSAAQPFPACSPTMAPGAFGLHGPTTYCCQDRVPSFSIAIISDPVVIGCVSPLWHPPPPPPTCRRCSGSPTRCYTMLSVPREVRPSPPPLLA